MTEPTKPASETSQYDPQRFLPLPRLTLEQEVRWEDVAPLLDELQKIPKLESLTVERWAFRPAAGGPGFDIVPVLFYLTVSAIVVEAVRDVIYPKLKGAIYTLYQRLPGMTPAHGKVYPFGMAVVEGKLQVSYRLPEGLTDASFGEALTSIPTHFASLPRGETQSLVFTYDPQAKSWAKNEGASRFYTWYAKKEAGEDPGKHPTD